MKFYFVLSFLISLVVVLPVSAAPLKYDLAVDHVTFSEEKLIAGTNVRLYARVQNLGTTDVKGYVSFYQGPSLIGESQVVSVRANGFADEVFIDFVVPDHQFNIRAVLQGIDRDENTSNDETLTTVITPLLDTDRDGVTDDKDVCPALFNTDQTDHDGDTRGDACDDDDDNDGVSDAREISAGTNPFAVDSDGDGASDATDAFPTDASRTAVPPPPPPPAPQKQAPLPLSTENNAQAVVEEIVPSAESSVSAPTTSAPRVNTSPTPASTITTPPPQKKREPTFSERVAYNDTLGFFEANNPRVWAAISTLGLLALASFVFERVGGARRSGLPQEPESPLLPLGPTTNLEPVAGGSPDKSKRKRKAPATKKKTLKSKKVI